VFQIEKNKMKNIGLIMCLVLIILGLSMLVYSFILGHKYFNSIELKLPPGYTIISNGKYYKFCLPCKCSEPYVKKSKKEIIDLAWDHYNINNTNTPWIEIKY
jgi:hypothetical protein